MLDTYSCDGNFRQQAYLETWDILEQGAEANIWTQVGEVRGILRNTEFVLLAKCY
jgi:hypothetical protein